MSPEMQRALEMAPGLAIMEAVFFVIWLARFWFMMRQGFEGEPFDNGPWWSVAFFRVWAACHIPVLALQMGLHWLLKKQTFNVSMPFALGAFLYHAINWLLVVAASSVKI